MIRVLITGAAGLLGEYIRKAFQYLPYCSAPELILTEHPKHPQVLENPEQFLPMDITDFSQVSAMLEATHPDVILHLAAYTDVSGAERNEAECRFINIDGTATIATAVNEMASGLCFVVYISTDYVFDGRRGDYREEDVTKPVNVYAQSKLDGENKIREILDEGRFLIIRTSFKPYPYKHDKAPTDLFTSAGYVTEIAPDIAFAVLNYEFVTQRSYSGIINIASKERSAYELASISNKDRDKPVVETTLEAIRVESGVSLPPRITLNSTRWLHIKQSLQGELASKARGTKSKTT